MTRKEKREAYVLYVTIYPSALSKFYFLNTISFLSNIIIIFLLILSEKI